jgi:peptidyl-prolyl cis-trans isomerase SurA
MKSLALILSFITGISLATLASAAPALPQPARATQSLDAIAAIVNNSVITDTELNQAIQVTKKNIQRQHQAIPPISELRNGVLQQLIYQKIQLQAAKRAGITVTDTQINDAINDIAKNNKTTVKHLKAKLAASNASFASFKKSIQQQLIVSQIQRDAISPTVKVTDTDINNFLSQYNAQPQNTTSFNVTDILIKPTSHVTKKERVHYNNITKNIASEIQGGTAITPISGGQKNDLGWVTAAQLPTAFAEKIASMTSAGAVGPIQAPNGLHILLVKGIRKGAHPQPSREQIQQMLFQQKFTVALEKWLKMMYKNAYVEIRHK